MDNGDYKRLLLVDAQIIHYLKKICAKKYPNNQNEQDSVIEEAELILNLYQNRIAKKIKTEKRRTFAAT